MSQQNSMRGQGFTLMVFGGLVALCSVFFILGMVVGRGQSVPETAEASESLATGRPAATDEMDAELDFYEAVTQDELSELAPIEPAPSPANAADDAAIEPAAEPDPAPADLPGVTEPVGPAPAGSGAVVLQLGAFRVEETAQGVATDVRGRGFSAFVSRPAGASQFYRVQVGPFTSSEEAARVQSQLEAQGFDVIPVR